MSIDYKKKFSIQRLYTIVSDFVEEILFRVFVFSLIISLLLLVPFLTYSIVSEIRNVSMPACDIVKKDSMRYVEIMSSKYSADNNAFLYEYNINKTKCSGPEMFNKGYEHKAATKTVKDIFEIMKNNR